MSDKLSLADVMAGKDRVEAEQDDEAIGFGNLKHGGFPRPANKVLPRLHIMLKDGTIHSFMNHQLDSNAVFKGSEFTLLFAGAEHLQVTVKGSGPHLWRCFAYICLHRWPFLVESTRGFPANEQDTVFTPIEIKDVTPKYAR